MCGLACPGSNGAEVQAITEGEDLCFRLRALLAEVNGYHLTRQNLTQVVRDNMQGVLVMDSKGIFDSMTRNVSALHGLKSGRAGYELTIPVSQAKEVRTSLRWVHGEAQLADALTKGGAAKKMMLQFFCQRPTMAVDSRSRVCRRQEGEEEGALGSPQANGRLVHGRSEESSLCVQMAS